MAFLYCRPSEIRSYGATVATSAGATDTEYVDEWVADARLGRPARSTNGTVTWALTFTSSEVGLVAVCNCNASVNAAITGGVSATVVAGELDEDGIRFNGCALVGPTTITTLSVGFSANPAGAVILGECLGAKVRTLARGLRAVDTTISHAIYSSDPEAEFASMNSYDKGMQSRVCESSCLVSRAERNILRGWYNGQRGLSLPGGIVPDSTVNDFWVVKFTDFRYQQVGADLFAVQLVFQEIPRKRWT